MDGGGHEGRRSALLLPARVEGSGPSLRRGQTPHSRDDRNEPGLRRGSGYASGSGLGRAGSVSTRAGTATDSSRRPGSSVVRSEQKQ